MKTTFCYGLLSSQAYWLSGVLGLLLAVVFFAAGVNAEQGGRPSISEKAARPPMAFQHALRFPAISQLPAEIRFETSEKGIASVRVLLAADSRFFILPLSLTEIPGVFSAKFPSPGKELTYRFQWEFQDGLVQLSEQFSSVPHCGAAEIRDAMQRAAGEDEKRALVREAILLDRDVERLRYAVEVLKNAPQ